MSMIEGHVAPGFEAVKAEFEKNFTERHEIGAACAIYHQGEKVVDLWGGYRDSASQLPWQSDTLVPVFSTTKGLAAMAIALAHSRGWLDYDAKVAAYWPEFAANGKEQITVRQLLAHQAGLCAIDTRLDARTVGNLDALAAVLAKQKPAWVPGTRHGYHALTLGWYEGELIRRVDPSHRSLGQFFAEEIARPLGLEFYIGLPSEVPEARIAVIKDIRVSHMAFHLNKMPWRFVLAMLNPWSLPHRTYVNPRLRRPSDLVGPEFRSLEIPAGNGVGQVRSIARAYSAFATGGQELAIGPQTLRELTCSATAPPEGLVDLVACVEMAYSLGFMKPFPGFRFGNDKAFGTCGLGGSFGFADPDAQVGYAYAPNRCGYYLWDDPREKALRETLYKCI